MQVLRNLAARNRFVKRLPAFEIASALLVQSAFARQHAGDLPRAVGAEVEVDADILVANLPDRLACGVDHDKGNEELIGHAVVVALLDARHRIGIRAALGLAVHHGVKCLALAFPALVAIHRVVAAVDGGHFAHAVLAHLLLELGDIPRAGVGRGVAAIHECVHEDALQSVLARHAQQRVEMFLVRVHAAVGDKSEQMQLRAALARPLHGLHDRRLFRELPCGNQRVDARDVHLHNAAGADVQVADFAVAHLPVGQADKVIGGLDQRVGKLAQQLVVSGLAGQRNGVVGGFSAIAPSVEDGQNERMIRFRHVFKHLRQSKPE